MGSILPIVPHGEVGCSGSLGLDILSSVDITDKVSEAQASNDPTLHCGGDRGKLLGSREVGPVLLLGEVKPSWGLVQPIIPHG